MILAVLTFSVLASAQTGGDLKDSVDRMAKLRTEIESSNQDWEVLRKEVQASREALLSRKLALESEVQQLRSQNQMQEARLQAAENRMNRRTRVLEQDRKALQSWMDRLGREWPDPFPFLSERRKSHWTQIQQAFAEGRGSTDDLVGEVKDLLEKDLVAIRGLHYFKEEIHDGPARLIVEGARLGAVIAVAAFPNGKVVHWKAHQSEPQALNDATAEKAALRLIHAAREKQKLGGLYEIPWHPGGLQ